MLPVLVIGANVRTHPQSVRESNQIHLNESDRVPVAPITVDMTDAIGFRRQVGANLYNVIVRTSIKGDWLGDPVASPRPDH